MPLFSVVIPTYNRADLLAETLVSVFNQTHTDYEVLVVDDGSTDGTSEVLAAYGNRLRVLRQQNRGAGTARNRGIEHAAGDYVAFLDSDDVWFPWTLATYFEVICAHGEPSFVTGSPFIFSLAKQLEQVGPGEVTVEAFPDYYASSNAWRWFSASSFVIRRDCLKATGGYHEGWGSEDADLAMMLGVEKGFVHIIAPHTFGYREQAKSLKTMPTYSLSGGKLMLKKEKEGMYPGGRTRERNRREILTRQVRPLSVACLRQGFWREAWKLYWFTFRWHISLRRWKYISAFPLTAALATVRPSRKLTDDER